MYLSHKPCVIVLMEEENLLLYRTMSTLIIGHTLVEATKTAYIPLYET